MSGPGTQAGLRVAGLVKEYPAPGGALRVLRGLSFELEPGASLVVLGASGSGKTTLLSLLGGLEPPSAGSIRLNGIEPAALDPAGLAAYRAAHVGFVFQEHHLLPQCTALENVLLGLLARGRVGAEGLARARALLAEVGLAERERHRPAELSGGERQRVALARALVKQPGLVLADEPTGNLDRNTARSVGRLLAGLGALGGASLVLATHDLELAALFPRRARLEEGVLIEVP